MPRIASHLTGAPSRRILISHRNVATLPEDSLHLASTWTFSKHREAERPRPDARSLTLLVRRLPDGTDARYDRGRRTVQVSDAVLAEDPRIVAVILAHELGHAAGLEWIAQGAVTLDCLGIETRGFEIEATVARAFWPGELPDGTDRERDLAVTVQEYERNGVDGLRAQLVSDATCQEQCADWRA